MQPAAESSRTILLANGKPAGSARVWTCSDLNSLYCGAPNQYYGDRLTKTQADRDGKFKLPSVPEDQPVILTHPGGFLATSVVNLQQNRVVQLQPWGSVEGILKFGGQPYVNGQVHLTTLLSWPVLGFHLSYSTTSSKDGSFIFTNVPAGDYKVYRVQRVRTGRPFTEDHRVPLTVKPGEVVKIEWPGDVRKIVGQAKADPPGLVVDWLNDDHTLTLKQPPIQPLNPEGFASITSHQEALRNSYRSTDRMKLAREARTYVLEFEEDGSFRAEDVPPGTYELRILVNKPGQIRPSSPFSSPKGDLGSLIREVVVPSGAGPFDLGTLLVPVKAGAETKTTKLLEPPMTLEAQTLDGRPFTLAQLKGQHVLLAFWAPWSQRSLEGLVDLQKLQADFQNDERIAFVGVSVDDDADGVRKVVEAGDYKWRQARLDIDSRAKVTAAFDVNSLPTVVLLDPEGRIAGRDLEGERLRKAVQRALSKK